MLFLLTRRVDALTNGFSRRRRRQFSDATITDEGTSSSEEIPLGAKPSSTGNNGECVSCSPFGENALKERWKSGSETLVKPLTSIRVSQNLESSGYGTLASVRHTEQVASQDSACRSCHTGPIEFPVKCQTKHSVTLGSNYPICYFIARLYNV